TGGRGTNDGVKVSTKNRKPKKIPVIDGSHQGVACDMSVRPLLLIMVGVFRSSTSKARAQTREGSRRLLRECPRMAQSGRSRLAGQCRLLDPKRTLLVTNPSAFSLRSIVRAELGAIFPC